MGSNEPPSHQNAKNTALFCHHDIVHLTCKKHPLRTTPYYFSNAKAPLTHTECYSADRLAAAAGGVVRPGLGTNPRSGLGGLASRTG